MCGNEQDWKERVWGGRGVRIWFWTCEYVNFGMSFGAVRLAECLMLLNVRLPLQGASEGCLPRTTRQRVPAGQQGTLFITVTQGPGRVEASLNMCSHYRGLDGEITSHTTHFYYLIQAVKRYQEFAPLMFICGPNMLVSCICQPDWATGCPDIRSNVTLTVSARLFPDKINT